jgi:hypothetical protein
VSEQLSTYFSNCPEELYFFIKISLIIILKKNKVNKECPEEILDKTGNCPEDFNI